MLRIDVVNCLKVLRDFDPWCSPLCTCPAKLTINPYTGCDHGCVYCYASSYIVNFSNCRPKRNLIQMLERDVTSLHGEMVSLSNSSDPYPNLETEKSLTRDCLEILSRSDCRIQIVTKSTLVVRDIDLLKKVPSVVSLTITTDDDYLGAMIEPLAPLPTERLKAAEKLVESDLPVTVRIDPIIPFVNDDPERLIKEVASLGVKHITCSTYKVRPDNWKRLCETLPSVAEKLRPLYFEKGQRISDYFYLPYDLRLRLMERVRSFADRYHISFGVCREDLSQLNTGVCDGSWLFRNRI
jgi:DNA repair photolyase